MSTRNFIKVVTEMLKFIPADDIIKPKLIKILEKYPYKAPEIRIFSWKEVQVCIIERFEENPDELPDWATEMIKVWKNEQ